MDDQRGGAEAAQGEPVKVRLVESTGAAKLGPGVSATYAPVGARADGGSCPRSCPLLGAGCYAEGGRVAMVGARLERKKGIRAIDLAREEAAAIDAAWQGGRVPLGWGLRLHVSGDARTSGAARALAGAAARWIRRGGSAPWSYTHAWRRVAREAWGAVSVLASLERAADADAARAQGYAPALVVESFPAPSWREAGILWIACPAQTARGATCSECRACWRADSLRDRGLGIAFSAHGVSRRRVLNVIQE